MTGDVWKTARHPNVCFNLHCYYTVCNKILRQTETYKGGVEQTKQFGRVMLGLWWGSKDELRLVVDPIDILVWTGKHRGFVVQAYFEKNKSVVATQRAFRQRFFYSAQQPYSWNNDLESGLLGWKKLVARLKQKKWTAQKYSENVQLVRAAVARTFRCNHVAALGMSTIIGRGSQVEF